jgi:hypothetical protein
LIGRRSSEVKCLQQQVGVLLASSVRRVQLRGQLRDLIAQLRGHASEGVGVDLFGRAQVQQMMLLFAQQREFARRATHLGPRRALLQSCPFEDPVGERVAHRIPLLDLLE